MNSLSYSTGKMTQIIEINQDTYKELARFLEKSTYTIVFIDKM